MPLSRSVGDSPRPRVDRSARRTGRCLEDEVRTDCHADLLCFPIQAPDPRARVRQKHSERCPDVREEREGMN